MAVWKVSFRTPTSASGCVVLYVDLWRRRHSTVKQNRPRAVQSFAHIVSGDRACGPARVVSEASPRDEEDCAPRGIEFPAKLLGLAIADPSPESEKFFLSCFGRLPPYRRYIYVWRRIGRSRSASTPGAGPSSTWE